MSSPREGAPGGALGLAVLVPALVTTVVYAPRYLRDAGAEGADPVFQLVAWAALLIAPPAVALVMNRRHPVASNGTRAALVGAAQLPLIVGLMVLDVWVDVWTGYLLAGSGEVQMALGFGTAFAVVVGAVLALLVGAGAWAGARHGTGRHGLRPAASS